MALRNAPWWGLAVVILLIVVVWPPQDDKSLAVKVLNWAVDPRGHLPTLPDQLPLGQGDDPVEVELHDAEVRRYDEMYLQGGWARRRLELKVAGDPFNASTVRQVLSAAAALAALYAWRLGSRKN